MERGLVLAHRLDILLRGDVLVADELGEVRRHLPDLVLEVHHDRVLVRRLDALQVHAEERRRSALRIWLEVLLDGELHVLRGHLAEPFVELHARTELERPRLELVRGLPLGRQARAVLEGLRVAHDQRVVGAIPQGLLGLARAPREGRLDPPLADRHDEAVARRDRTRRGDERGPHCCRGRSPLEERASVDRHRVASPLRRRASAAIRSVAQLMWAGTRPPVGRERGAAGPDLNSIAPATITYTR